jgi:hypothetical protein
MSTRAAPPVSALDAQAAANLFLSDNLPDRFSATDPQLDEGREVWRVPVLLTYAVIGSVGQVGEIVVSANKEEISSHTPLPEMKERALALYEEHRAVIETPLP